jgi:hypothetical protein
MASKKPYKRFPGTGYRKTLPRWVIAASFFALGIFALLLRGRRVQLWEGEEELLLVESNGYTENYKRFKYRDIQAFLICKNNQSRNVTFALFVIAGLSAIPAIVTKDIAVRVCFIFIASLFALIGLVNGLLGPSCDCSLRTAVQTDEMPSLTRLRHARKVLKSLRLHVTAAQGELGPQDLTARLHSSLPPVIHSPAPAAPISMPPRDSAASVTTPETSLAPPAAS